LPKVTRETIPGGGHIVSLDSSDAFNAIATRFIRKFTNDPVLVGASSAPRLKS
jgi:hypothetical protein